MTSGFTYHPQSDHYVGANEPPILLVYGMLDGLAPQSRALYDALVAKGNKAEILGLPEVAHSFIGATQALTQDASWKALDRTFAFIDETIGDKK
jgi:dipeptidyl aminopeptidase/acylaminoacyl peptidase